jgi:hypothetical protein
VVPLPDLLIIALALLASLWLFVTIVVIAACQMAALSDAERASSRPSQSPRRASTWGIVRKRILRSPQSDQFATYR